MGDFTIFDQFWEKTSYILYLRLPLAEFVVLC